MMSDELKLNDAFVAWRIAGIDKDFTFFKVYTRKLFDAKLGESGQFELSCSGSITDIETSSDPVGKLKKMAREYIIHAVTSTGIDMDKWVIEFSPAFANYQIPSHLFLDTARDRAWLA